MAKYAAILLTGTPEDKTTDPMVNPDTQSHQKLQKWALKNISIGGTIENKTGTSLQSLVDTNKWKLICHHMTIKYPGVPESISHIVYPTNIEPVNVKLVATHWGIYSENGIAKAISVKVISEEAVSIKSKNKGESDRLMDFVKLAEESNNGRTPHITIAISKVDGGKAEMGGKVGEGSYSEHKIVPELTLNGTLQMLGYD